MFTFKALQSTQTRVTVTVPTTAGWTEPQDRFATSSGFVRVAKGTCNSAAITAVTGARDITVSTKCADLRNVS